MRRFSEPTKPKGDGDLRDRLAQCLEDPEPPQRPAWIGTFNDVLVVLFVVGGLAYLNSFLSEPQRPGLATYILPLLLGLGIVFIRHRRRRRRRGQSI